MKHLITPKIHKFILFFIFFSCICISCSDDDTTVNCIPNVNVAAQYNLNLPSFLPLNYPNGYVQLPSDGTNGDRGVIIVNTGNGFLAFDRNAPHTCPAGNTTLEVRDDIRIVCPADGAEWALRNGQPLNDQTNGRTPRRFFTTIEGSILTLTY